MNRLSKSSILAAGLDATSRRSPNSVTSRLGLEGAVHLAVMACAHSGCEVWQQDFLKLDLPDNHFDGVFANAALFHVPSQELPRVLLELKASLKPGGVLSQLEFRVAITRKAGARGATACIMILTLGAAICQSPGSLS